MKKVFSFLAIFIVAIMLTACGSKVGTYKLVEMEAGGEKVDAASLEQFGLKMELIIKDDKNAVLKIADDEKETALTYDDKTFTGIDEETGEEESIPYTFEGNKIILSQDGQKLVFQK